MNWRVPTAIIDWPGQLRVECTRSGPARRTSDRPGRSSPVRTTTQLIWYFSRGFPEESQNHWFNVRCERSERHGFPAQYLRYSKTRWIVWRQMALRGAFPSAAETGRLGDPRRKTQLDERVPRVGCAIRRRRSGCNRLHHCFRIARFPCIRRLRRGKAGATKMREHEIKISKVSESGVARGGREASKRRRRQ